MKATIIADNVAPQSPDCSTTVPLRTQGTNLVEDTSGCAIAPIGKSTLIEADPMLGPLQDNGGPTETHALLPGSARRSAP